MDLDLEKIKEAAQAAGGGQWSASDGVVWFDDGDTALVAGPVHQPTPVFAAFDNIGMWPDPIDRVDVAEFAALVCPTAVLELVRLAEIGRLVEQKFRSGNSVPVTRITIDRAEVASCLNG